MVNFLSHLELDFALLEDAAIRRLFIDCAFECYFLFRALIYGQINRAARAGTYSLDNVKAWYL
jgi:hypothetical protein